MKIQKDKGELQLGIRNEELGMLEGARKLWSAPFFIGSCWLTVNS